MLPPVGALITFPPSSSRTLNKSSTFFQNTRRSEGVSAADGYSAKKNEEESLWRSFMLRVLVMFGVAGVGNSEMIHLDNLSYASSSNTGMQDDQSTKLANDCEHTQPTREDILQDVGVAAERCNHPRNRWAGLKTHAFDRT